jgi:hypothetical protein
MRFPPTPRRTCSPHLVALRSGTRTSARRFGAEPSIEPGFRPYYVWNNDGDRARLRRANGTLADSCAYSGAGRSILC